MAFTRSAPIGRRPSVAMPAGKQSVVCFSANDWSDIPSSKAHIMRSLGKTNKVLYIDTLGIRTPRFSNHDFKRAIHKVKLSLRGLRNVENELYVWSPPAIPFHGSPLSRRINATVLSIAINRLMAHLKMEDTIIWSYLPNAVGIIKKLRASKIVYHCIDDYGEFTNCPKTSFQQMEREMLQTADLTVVSSKRLLELRRPDAKQIAYIPHGVDVDFFRAAAKTNVVLPDIAEIRRPIAGFVGRIADWVDLELIARCARVRTDWSFVFVGPSNVDLRKYEDVANLHFLGRKDHKDIPHYIKMFDVCLIPFVENDLVASVNPLKMYEYLALGKPVVSTPMSEVRALADVVDIAGGEDFPEAIQQAYSKDSDTARRARIEAISARSWATVTEEIMTLLNHGQASPDQEISPNKIKSNVSKMSPPCLAAVIDHRDAVPDYLVSLAVGLSQNTKDFLVICSPGAVDRFKKACPRENARLYPYFGLKFKNRVRNILPYVRGWFRTIILLIRVRPRVLHLQWLVHPLFEGLFVPVLTRLLGCRLVYTVHNVLPHDRSARSVRQYRRFYRRCNQLIVHNRVSRERLLELCPDIRPKDVVLIPHGNYDHLIADDLSPIQARKELGLDPEVPIILFVGKLRPYKGILLLIEAFQRCSRELRARLLIAGRADDSRYFAEIQRALDAGFSDNIQVINRFLSDRELQVTIAAADIVVLPYREIDQSGILLYAMTLGKAIIVPQLASFVETLGNAASGALFYPPGDSEELAVALRRLVLDPELRRSVGCRARAIASSDFSWSSIGKKTSQLYEMEM